MPAKKDNKRTSGAAADAAAKKPKTEEAGSPALCTDVLKNEHGVIKDESKSIWDTKQFHKPRVPKPKIMGSILENIGETPIVRMERLSKNLGIECELLAKCEFFNSGGSVKDRIGLRMIEDAERTGRLKPGDTIIEPTSGNTGIGLALTAAIKGYKTIITLPEKMSAEKVNVLKALGATIYRTPTEAAFDSPESHLSLAKRLNDEIPNSHILNQYDNPGNPLAHYDGTAEEILESCDGKLDYLFAGAGTGGTITGIAKKLKEKIPGIKIIGVDPMGSILARPHSINLLAGPNQVEGIGYDFVPTVCERPLVDEWVKSEDKESFQMSRRLIKEEGLLCGGSSGSAMYSAIRYIKEHKIGKGKRVLVMLADGTRNYMTKFLSPNWMREHKFMDEDEEEGTLTQEWWGTKTVNDLNIPTPMLLNKDVTCARAMDILQKNGIDQMPIVCKDTQETEGMVSVGNLMSKIASGKVGKDDPVSKAMYKDFVEVPLSMSLPKLSTILDAQHFALVYTNQQTFGSDMEVASKKTITGIVTRIDLLNYMIGGAPAEGADGSIAEK